MKGAEPAHHRSTARRADLSSLARGGLVSFLGVVGHAAFGFLIVVVVTRGLPKSDVGVFFEAVAVFSILAGIALWGADIGLVRTIPRLRILGRRQDLPTVLEVSISPIVLVAVVLALAVFALAPWLARTLATGGEERLVELLRILCLLAPLAAATNATLAATRGFGSMAPTTLIDKIGRSAAQLVLVWGVVAAGWGSSRSPSRGRSPTSPRSPRLRPGCSCSCAAPPTAGRGQVASDASLGARCSSSSGVSRGRVGSPLL